MEEDLNAALDGILLGDLSEAEGKEEDIDSMTAKLGGQGDRLKHQVEGGRREGSSSSEEKGGVEVLSEIDFRDPKFTSTSNP